MAQCPINTLPNGLNANVGIQSLTVPKKLTIGGNINCPDISLQLRYDPEIPYWGHLALTTGGNYQLYTTLIPQSPTQLGDIVLSATNARDVIITTMRNEGKLRFATSEITNQDVERMTIVPTGQVGIWNNEPKNLLSTRNTLGMDFWNSNESFQDIRFNCYAGSYFLGDSEESSEQDTSETDSPVQVIHKNIQGGFSSIIQSISQSGEGKLLMATTKNNEDPNTNLNFFEQDPQFVFQPRGIMIQSFTWDSKEFATIGLGTMPDYLSRVKIQGRTSDNTMNALKIVNWTNSPLLTVRNDGVIKIGEKLFVDGDGEDQLLTDDAELKLSVDGAIVAKEILVTTYAERWPDFVFDKNYKLLSISDLEKYISINKRLPDFPGTKEVQMNGLNIGRLQEKLLQKIEELTLYIIELKKENDTISKSLNEIKLKFKEK